MYKFEFTLKQHTPLIHFQHEQTGATLRATEVKPKLDRFIIEKLTGKTGSAAQEEFKTGTTLKIRSGNNFINNPHFNQNWCNMLIGGSNEHLSLDYKICFKTSGNHFNESIPYSETNDGKFRPSFPCMFGNVDSIEDKKHVSFSDFIHATIISKNSTLITALKPVIHEFFLRNNFGFRQSKGFGSFYIDEMDDCFNFPSSKYHFSIDSSPQDAGLNDFINVFKAIDLLYKTLRSGINTTKSKDGIYFKSMMFLYAKTLNQQWDKKTLRDFFYSNHELYVTIKNTRKSDPNGTVCYNAPKKENLLFRDLLGLSTEQDWMGYGRPKKHGGFNSDTLVKKSINGNVERFQSPVLFKPIKLNNQNWNIFLIFNAVPQNYLGHKMDVSSKSYNTNNQMTIPISFDMEAFMHFCFKTAFPTDDDFRKHIGHSKSQTASTLENIYSQLRNC